MSINSAELLYSEACKCFTAIKHSTEKFEGKVKDGEMLVGFAAWKMETHNAMEKLVENTGMNVIPGEFDYDQPETAENHVNSMLYELTHEVIYFETLTVFGGTEEAPHDYVKDVLDVLVGNHDIYVEDFCNSFKRKYLPRSDADADCSKEREQGQEN